jgi:hypothetical protein
MPNNKDRGSDLVKGLRSNIANVFKDISLIHSRITDLSKEVRLLSDMFNKEDNWGNTAKNFLQNNVRLSLQLSTGGPPLACTIAWIDKYTLGVRVYGHGDVITVVFKSAIVTMTPV